MSDQTKITKAHCNKCGGTTRHFVLAEKQYSANEHDDHGNFMYGENSQYEMLECCGCENVTLRSVWSSSEEQQPTTTYFPPAVSRRKPDWFHTLALWEQLNIRALMDEVYNALYAGSNRIAMMGARCVIDMVMTEKVGDSGTFVQKLDEMQSKGYISVINRDFLKVAIEVGNAAAHRGHRPDDKDVNRVMDIVENLIQTVYVLESAAKNLTKNTPPRPPKPSSAPPSPPSTSSPNA